MIWLWPSSNRSKLGAKLEQLIIRQRQEVADRRIRLEKDREALVELEKATVYRLSDRMRRAFSRLRIVSVRCKSTAVFDFLIGVKTVGNAVIGHAIHRMRFGQLEVAPFRLITVIRVTCPSPLICCLKAFWRLSLMPRIEIELVMLFKPCWLAHSRRFRWAICRQRLSIRKGSVETIPG